VHPNCSSSCWWSSCCSAAPSSPSSLAPWVRLSASSAEAAVGALAQSDLPDHVQRALLDLPADYRAAVVLSDVVGLPYEQIAEALGIPIGTVRSRIHRGRARLKVVLAA